MWLNVAKRPLFLKNKCSADSITSWYMNSSTPHHTQVPQLFPRPLVCWDEVELKDTMWQREELQLPVSPAKRKCSPVVCSRVALFGCWCHTLCFRGFKVEEVDALHLKHTPTSGWELFMNNWPLFCRCYWVGSADLLWDSVGPTATIKFRM